MQLLVAPVSTKALHLIFFTCTGMVAPKVLPIRTSSTLLFLGISDTTSLKYSTGS